MRIKDLKIVLRCINCNMQFERTRFKTLSLVGLKNILDSEMCEFCYRKLDFIRAQFNILEDPQIHRKKIYNE